MLQVVLFVAAVFVLAVVCRALQPGGEDLREPFAALSGASAWPSQLLRTLAIVLFAWFLDYAWCKTAQEADVVGAKYFPAKADAPAPEPAASSPSMGALILGALVVGAIGYVIGHSSANQSVYQPTYDQPVYQPTYGQPVYQYDHGRWVPRGGQQRYQQCQTRGRYQVCSDPHEGSQHR